MVYTEEINRDHINENKQAIYLEQKVKSRQGSGEALGIKKEALIGDCWDTGGG